MPDAASTVLSTKLKRPRRRPAPAGLGTAATATGALTGGPAAAGAPPPPASGLSGNAAVTTPLPEASAFSASATLRCGRLKATATGSIWVMVSSAGPVGDTLLPTNTATGPTRPALGALMRA